MTTTPRPGSTLARLHAAAEVVQPFPTDYPVGVRSGDLTAVVASVLAVADSYEAHLADGGDPILDLEAELIDLGAAALRAPSPEPPGPVAQVLPAAEQLAANVATLAGVGVSAAELQAALDEREVERRRGQAQLEAEAGLRPEPPGITAVHQSIARAHLADAYEQTSTLGALIDHLEKLAPEMAVRYEGAGLDGQVPSAPNSSRGNYADLALGHLPQFTVEEPEPWQPQPLRTVGELLAALRDAEGRTYEGYKGGDYTMTRRTPVWIDNWSEWTNTALVGVSGTGYQFPLELLARKVEL